MNALILPDPTLETIQGFLEHFDLSAVAHPREELTNEQKASIASLAKS
jgi:hypothetical protein